MPIAVKHPYQGQTQQFDLASNAEFPAGMGKCLRNVVGQEMSRIGDSFELSSARALARLIVTDGRLGGVRFLSRIKLPLPRNVCDASDMAPEIVQEERWSLAEATA